MSAKALAKQTAAALRDVQRHEANPLDLVPDGYLADAVRLWTRNHHVLPNPLSLATRLREWIDEEGLTPEEWAAVVRKASRPERQATLDTGPKFMADLAGLVAEAVKWRERQAENGRQLDAVRARPVAGGPAVIQDMLKEAGLAGRRTPC